MKGALPSFWEPIRPGRGRIREPTVAVTMSRVEVECVDEHFFNRRGRVMCLRLVLVLRNVFNFFSKAYLFSSAPSNGNPIEFTLPSMINEGSKMSKCNDRLFKHAVLTHLHTIIPVNPESGSLMLTRYLMPDFFVSVLFSFSIKTFREGRIMQNKSAYVLMDCRYRGQEGCCASVVTKMMLWLIGVITLLPSHPIRLLIRRGHPL